MNKFTRCVVSFGSAALAFLFIFSIPASQLHSQLIPIVAKPQILGSVHLQGPLLAPFLAVFLTITTGGTPIPSLTIKVDDRYSVPHISYGFYNATIGHWPLAYDMPLKISIKSPIRTDPEIFADGSVSALAEFVSPMPSTIIDLRTTEFVKVEWRFSAGSATVEKLLLTREGGGGR